MNQSDKSKTSGFGAIGILITVVVIAVVGFVGWKVYDSQKPKPNTSNYSSAQQTDPNAGYVVIQDWGVRLKAADGLVGLKGVARTSSLNGAQEMMLITDDMQKLGPACNGAADGSRPLGALVRAQSQISAPNTLRFLKQIDTYYYYYYAPASSCSPVSTEETTQSTNLAKVKESLASLEAVK